MDTYTIVGFTLAYLSSIIQAERTHFPLLSDSVFMVEKCFYHAAAVFGTWLKDGDVGVEGFMFVFSDLPQKLVPPPSIFLASLHAS